MPESVTVYTWKLEDRFVAPNSPASNVPSSQDRDPSHHLGTSVLNQPPIPSERPIILYVGGESLALMNVLILNAESQVGCPRIGALLVQNPITRCPI